MRAIVSTIGTLPYGISQYLVELIQPTLTKSKYKIANSLSFVNEAKNWLVKRDEVQVSYDIVNLYPSVSIIIALDVLIDQLNNDKNDLMKRTKLRLKDIYELAELVLVNVISRSIEYQQESIKGNWSCSGATEHTKECHGHFDWLHPKTLSMKNKYYD